VMKHFVSGLPSVLPLRRGKHIFPKHLKKKISPIFLQLCVWANCIVCTELLKDTKCSPLPPITKCVWGP
jgi:hypothetical protein